MGNFIQLCSSLTREWVQRGEVKLSEGGHLTWWTGTNMGSCQFSRWDRSNLGVIGATMDEEIWSQVPIPFQYNWTDLDSSNILSLNADSTTLHSTCTSLLLFWLHNLTECSSGKFRCSISLSLINDANVSLRLSVRRLRIGSSSCTGLLWRMTRKSSLR